MFSYSSSLKLRWIRNNMPDDLDWAEDRFKSEVLILSCVYLVFLYWGPDYSSSITGNPSQIPHNSQTTLLCYLILMLGQTRFLDWVLIMMRRREETLMMRLTSDGTTLEDWKPILLPFGRLVLLFFTGLPILICISIISRNTSKNFRLYFVLHLISCQSKAHLFLVNVPSHQARRQWLTNGTGFMPISWKPYRCWSLGFFMVSILQHA